MKNQRVTDLSYKEVIDLETGQRLVYVRDAEIDPEGSMVTALIIPVRRKLLWLLGLEEERVIPWEHIRRLGEDIIFVRI